MKIYEKDARLYIQDLVDPIITGNKQGLLYLAMTLLKAMHSDEIVELKAENTTVIIRLEE